MFYVCAVLIICLLFIIGYIALMIIAFIRKYYYHIQATKHVAGEYGRASFRRFIREYNEVCNHRGISKRIRYSPSISSITFNNRTDHITVAQFTDYLVEFDVPAKRYMLFGLWGYLRYCDWFEHNVLLLTGNYVSDLWKNKEEEA